MRQCDPPRGEHPLRNRSCAIIDLSLPGGLGSLLSWLSSLDSVRPIAARLITISGYQGANVSCHLISFSPKQLFLGLDFISVWTCDFHGQMEALPILSRESFLSRGTGNFRESSGFLPPDSVIFSPKPSCSPGCIAVL